MEQVNAGEYWRLGGKLNRDGLKKAKRVLSALTKGGKPESMKNTSLSQAQNMADFSQVTITPEQKYLYAVLREMSGEDDQPLLAEVFLLTGDMAKRNSFMDTYPNIFKTEK